MSGAHPNIDATDDAGFLPLANAAVDGAISAADAARLSDAIAASPARAAEFARLAMLHDALEREMNAAAAGRAVARRARNIARFRRIAAVAAMLALAALLGWFSLQTTREASASEIVARLVASAKSGDRTYFLRAVGASPAAPAVKRSGKPAPSIDGAILYVRERGEYVLARLDADGDEVLSGSDGARSWIVPAKGPVRVSSDPRRFSGALPGSQQGIAFIDPHADLVELAKSYELTLKPATDADALARIVGVRRSDARGGPKRIEISYDESTALIRAIRLENLPQARSGPRTVEFELVDDAPLARDFFTHAFHHDASRVVIEED
jgi:hypothetical protein